MRHRRMVGVVVVALMLLTCTVAYPELARTFRTAGQAQASAMWKYRAGQGVAILGLAGAGVFGWDAYQQSREAWSMFQDSTLRGTALPYMQTGIAAGRLAEAMTLGLGSSAQLGLLEHAGFKVLGQAAGKDMVKNNFPDCLSHSILATE